MIPVLESQNIKAESLVLAEGRFANDEARDLLIDLLNTEINFYKIQNLRSQVRFGIDDESAQKRITSLTEKIQRLKMVLIGQHTADKVIFMRAELHMIFSEDTFKPQ